MKRSSNAIYLGYGLLIGILLAVLAGFVLVTFRQNDTARALVNLNPSESSALLPSPLVFPTLTETSTPDTNPSPTFTPTPTYIVWNPTATATPIPTATLSLGEEKFQNGELAIAGPLTQEQQIRLYETSLRFIALTTRDAIAVGEQFAGKGYGSPTLICGPLSIHILQEAGLLSTEYLVPLDFWLLNPFLPKDRALANRTFPPEKYEHHEIATSLRRITFSTFPLYPGDFLYIKHGTGGTFDHMLVVNRVDSTGRAYAVTNYNTEQGYIINEVMLYDPNDRAAGIFMQWTARQGAALGATGFSGFELWRLRNNQ